jgi:hypothetical protein
MIKNWKEVVHKKAPYLRGLIDYWHRECSPCSPPDFAPVSPEANEKHLTEDRLQQC